MEHHGKKTQLQNYPKKWEIPPKTLENHAKNGNMEDSVPASAQQGRVRPEVAPQLLEDAIPWENHGTPWENNGKNNGKTMGNQLENYGETTGKQWKTIGKLWKNNGKPWKTMGNHGKTMGKQ